MDLLETPIEYLKGIGPGRAGLFKEELGIKVFRDFLHFFPNRYIDRTTFYSLGNLPQNNSEVQIKGVIMSHKIIPQAKGKRLVAVLSDDTSTMEMVWFRGHKWVQDNLRTGVPYVAFGRLNWYKNIPSMPHPELTLEAEYEQSYFKGFYPIYPSTEKLINKGISQKVIRQSIEHLFRRIHTDLTETLPLYIREELRLVSRKDATIQIHFPANQNRLTQAQIRLKFEELFYIQMQLIQRKRLQKQKIKGHFFKQVGSNFNRFYSQRLSFDLTSAQQRVVREIRRDMNTGKQMNRLLQGDVGSGKTIVALLTMLIAIDNGFQTCLMTPTEVLSQQHYQSIKEVLGDMDIEVALLTGSSKTAERKVIHEALKKGTLHILIGTHALIEEKVQFNNLGLAIIDEQHRFGVAQRAKLWKKNTTAPHILVMTATPIPRTLAMSIYGDLDISVIDELPPGRKPVKTVVRSDANRLGVFKFVRDQIKLGRQVYVVYPLIKESEKVDYKDLMDGYESLAREFPTPVYQISIVHGKMKPKDKDFEMQRFVEGKTQIMVATTVIEVGVNVPNASVMIIESAERFGLSQLHQLRGRVGRGNDQSYCILISGVKKSADANTRLQTMAQTSDGFEIAEIDLRLRGPGNLMGTQQSGVLQLKIADIIRDHDLLKTARHYAQSIVKNDPTLSDKKHQEVKATYAKVIAHKNIWNFIS